jgi:hypothetical protein
VPDRYLVLSWVLDLTGELGKELDHLLIDAGQTILIQRDTYQHRDVALGHRLHIDLVVNGPAMEVLLGDQMAVLDHQQTVEGLELLSIVVQI